MKLERWMAAAALVICTGMIVQPTALAKGKKGGGSKAPPQQQQTSDTTSQETNTPPASQPADPITVATAAMDAAAKKARAAFESGDEWKAANDNCQAARDAYHAASTNVTAALKTRPDYVAAVAAKTKAEDDLDALRNAGATGDQISAAADNAMTARTAVTQIESTASTSDPTVVDAKAKLTAANAALAEERKKEELAVQADPDWQAAKKQYDDAKANAAALANKS